MLVHYMCVCTIDMLLGVNYMWTWYMCLLCTRLYLIYTLTILTHIQEVLRGQTRYQKRKLLVIIHQFLLHQRSSFTRPLSSTFQSPRLLTSDSPATPTHTTSTTTTGVVHTGRSSHSNNSSPLRTTPRSTYSSPRFLKSSSSVVVKPPSSSTTSSPVKTPERQGRLFKSHSRHIDSFSSSLSYSSSTASTMRVTATSPLSDGLDEEECQVS